MDIDAFIDELEKISLAASPQEAPEPPKAKKSVIGTIGKGLAGIAAIGAGGGLAYGLLGRSARGLRAARKFGVTSAEAIPRSQSGIVNWWRGVS